jgi:hypothetical protein
MNPIYFVLLLCAAVFMVGGINTVIDGHYLLGAGLVVVGGALGLAAGKETG